MVALTAYPVLAGRRDLRELGGAQVQQVMIARALVSAGVRVSFICMDYGQAPVETIDGIEVHRCFAPNAGVKGLRFIYPRLWQLVAVMRRVDADVYYQRCAGMSTGVVAAWSRWAGKAGIYAGASDLDFHPGPPNVRGARDRLLFNKGLAAMSAVVVQNPRQQALLRENHGLEGVLIPSCYMPDSPRRKSQRLAGQGGEILWVGMIRKVKRPDRFLQLARALPHRRFRMIGGAMGDSPDVLQYYEDIKTQARDLPNLEFMGFVPFAEVDPYFGDAALLVNTSDHEGFPNTFLQAWSREVPSVAFFDTGSRLNGAAPYVIASDDEDLVRQVEALLSQPSMYADYAQRGKQFFVDEHSPEQTAQRYLDLLDRLCGRTEVLP